MLRKSTKKPVQCKVCPQIIFATPTEITKGRKQFCSHACRAKSQQVSPEERFYQHLPEAADSNGCLNWIGHATERGYGMLKIRAGFTVRSHRFAYYLAHGEFDQSMNVLHTCDNPRCVNPLHLFLGTTKDNSDDMVTKGRSLKGERNPESKLTNTIVADILLRYRGGMATPKQLSEEFGVTYNCINLIVTRKSWRHIP